MGWTFAISVIRAEIDQQAHRQGFEAITNTPATWHVYVAPREIRPRALESATLRLANEANAPAICAYVGDSDWAFISAMTPKDVSSRVVIDPLLADGYEEGAEALNLLGGESRDDMESLADWSTLAPRSLSTEVVRRICEAEYVTREEALISLFLALEIEVDWQRI